MVNLFSDNEVSPTVALYSQIAQKAAELLQVAQQERWDDFPSVEAQMNALVLQLEKFPLIPESADDHEILLQQVYLKQIMADNEKTSFLVKQRTQSVENFLKSSTRRSKLNASYGQSGNKPG